MRSVSEHVLARKIPVHAKIRPLFYMPIKSTVLDAVIYLDPGHFDHVSEIFRNHEKVPFHTVLENDDIITYTLDEKPTLTKHWLESVHSGISRWRVQNKINKKTR